jgi:hypothetical protein
MQLWQLDWSISRRAGPGLPIIAEKGESKDKDLIFRA